MGVNMSLQTRKELTEIIRLKYRQSSWKGKCKILDEFVATTGYQRKHAIKLLGASQPPLISNKKRGRKPKYNQEVKDALLICYRAVNEICPKRFVPFLKELVKVLKKYGNLSLTPEVEEKLLKVSTATAERIIHIERKKQGKGITTTKPGSLLKKQIQVRTFSDWDDVKPGFMEADLVAHCGGSVHGSFLNTFTLTDIFSGWTEPLAILCKSSDNVISGLELVQEILPFKLLGLDTDNGSEFINYDLLDYCKEKKITFTRSRAYRKNDQAHVEEKNGSVVRRIVGYDRFEGVDAWKVLVKLYSILRLYVNYFQPSLKLLSKTRNGSHVTKKYEKAKTPCQRLLESEDLSIHFKNKLIKNYEKLNPVELLEKIKLFQDEFWRYAWSQDNSKSNEDKVGQLDNAQIINSTDDSRNNSNNRKFRKTRKPRKELAPRTWQTKEDAFKDDIANVFLKLEVEPNRTAKNILDELIKDNPEKYNPKQLRTLQRRVKKWRIEWLSKIEADVLRVVKAAAI